MHSSRMRTGRAVTAGGLFAQVGVSAGGGAVCLMGVSAGGAVVSYDLSHHAFDVTCMLSQHQLNVNTSAAAYIVWPWCMMGYNPPPVNRMTDRCKNITLPQLCLRAVNIFFIHGQGLTSCVTFDILRTINY